MDEETEALVSEARSFASRLLEQDGALYPLEARKTASPGRRDVRNLSAIEPVAGGEAPSELRAFRREMGMGAVICMAEGAYFLDSRAWAFPVWAV